ncbi:MAG: TraB/GumN family protein, partial [Pseudomonadales bacterium]|nr:TraB/GumN family protein [Pseudomonadales bacterium]
STSGMSFWHGLLAVVALTACLLSALPALTQAQEKAQGKALAQENTQLTSVWEVSSAEHQLFLGGTIHLLRAADFPLPEQFEIAYEAADKIYFETDINAMNDLGFQAQMLQTLTYQDERTLQSVLNEEAYLALNQYAAKSGLPLAMMQKFKPGLLIATLSVLEVQKLGFTPEGVDMHFASRVAADGKPMGELESLDTQLSYLAAMGEGNESEFVLVSLADFEQTAEMMEQMVTAWRAGDDEALSRYFVNDLKSRSPEVYQSLLVDRNENWRHLIEAMLETPERELVLVGAAHLLGDDGLLAMLSAGGYEVRQLPLP